MIQMAIAMHGLPKADLLRLAGGAGTSATVGRLCAAERSKHILLLHTVIAEAESRFPEAHAALELADAWEFLSRVQRCAPATVADVLQMPQLGAWAVGCLFRMEHTDADSTALRADLAQVGAFAAVAGLRAGVAFDLPVAPVDGRLVLPGLGPLSTSVRGPCRLLYSGGKLELVTGGTTVPVTPPRPITVAVQHAGLTWEVDIDFSTPSLDCFRHRRLETVDRAEAREWSERIAGAWRILAVHHRSDAESMSVSVRTLVPLEADGRGSTVAATSASAFGAIATTLPSDDLVLAETLVHEFQHLKLCSVLDLLPLVDSVPGGLFYAPWRDDPRPPGALLHGVYAYLGVTGFWRTQRWHLSPGQALRGHAEFVRRRAETLAAAEDLLASGRLTAEGRRFVGEASRRLRAWERDPVPEEARRLGLNASLEHRAVWEVRHVAVSPDTVRRLVGHWTARRRPRPSDWSGAPHRVRPAARSGPRIRERLLTLRYVDPRRFRELLETEGPVGGGGLGLGAADAALLRGDLDAAAAGYREEIRRHPAAPEAWAGLVLAMDGRSDPAAALLRRRVPLVSALYAAIRASGGAADPLELAGWLAGRASDGRTP
ncbi:HEXXH motif domain-containing protein [Streptacidiphilus alkalitolerans]|uniref:HEXXH motif domain-containing protein n=2 Tax=Streptacidiphilus alkalitolerans TaxID=3342712 RepID=A0ABV6VDK4_9ACTN